MADAAQKPTRHDVVQPLSDGVQVLLDTIDQLQQTLPAQERIKLHFFMLGAGTAAPSCTANAVIALAAFVGFNIAKDVAEKKREVFNQHAEKN